jgi:hypothetical protein
MKTIRDEMEQYVARLTGGSVSTIELIRIAFLRGAMASYDVFDQRLRQERPGEVLVSVLGEIRELTDKEERIGEAKEGRCDVGSSAEEG